MMLGLLAVVWMVYSRVRGNKVEKGTGAGRNIFTVNMTSYCPVGQSGAVFRVLSIDVSKEICFVGLGFRIFTMVLMSRDRKLVYSLTIKQYLAGDF